MIGCSRAVRHNGPECRLVSELFFYILSYWYSHVLLKLSVDEKISSKHLGFRSFSPNEIFGIESNFMDASKNKQLSALTDIFPISSQISSSYNKMLTRNLRLNSSVPDTLICVGSHCSAAPNWRISIFEKRLRETERSLKVVDSVETLSVHFSTKMKLFFNSESMGNLTDVLAIIYDRKRTLDVLTLPTTFYDLLVSRNLLSKTKMR